jgi:hypothetical protein
VVAGIILTTLSDRKGFGTVDQEITQYLSSWLMSHDTAVVTVAFVAAFLEARLKLPELLEIGFADHRRFGHHAEGALQIGKSDGAVKVKTHFLWVQDMK